MRWPERMIACLRSSLCLVSVRARACACVRVCAYVISMCLHACVRACVRASERISLELNDTGLRCGRDLDAATLNPSSSIGRPEFSLTQGPEFSSTLTLSGAADAAPRLTKRSRCGRARCHAFCSTVSQTSRTYVQELFASLARGWRSKRPWIGIRLPLGNQPCQPLNQHACSAAWSGP